MRPTASILLVFLGLLGCSDGPGDDSGTPLGTCEAAPGEPDVLEISHYSTFTEPLGDFVYCGIPPQGGAPYAPFGVRVRGVMPQDNDAMTVTVTATDTDTAEVVGRGVFTNVFLCSNVGENEGYWLLNEIHLRFDGHTLDDLHERSVSIAFEAEGSDGVVSESFPFELDCVAGD